MEKMYASEVPLVGKKCYAAYQKRTSLCPWCPSIKTRETGKAHSEIVPYPSAEKPAGWIEISTYPLKDTNGFGAGIIELVKDVTERKRMEEDLKESEEKYRNLFKTSPEAVFLEDMDGGIVSVNQKGCEIYGYSREEMLKLNVVDIVPPDISGNYALLINNLKQKRFLFFESRARRKNGESFQCDLGASLVKVGNRDYVQVVIKDISDRKLAEKELAKHRYHLEELVKERTAQLTNANDRLQREIAERKRAEATLLYSEERYRQVVSTTTDAIMVFDAETRQFIEVNKACEELYGYSREEFLGITHTDIAADPEQSDASIRRAIKGKLSRLPIRYHRKKDGAIFPVEISSSTFMYKGRLVICGVIRNITERKRAEEELKKYWEHLEELVEERTEDLRSEISERKKIERELKRSQSALQVRKEALEQKNIALREVLEQIEVEKREMKDAVAANVEEFLLPILRKLRGKASRIEEKHLDVLEDAMEKITSLYGRRISEPRLRLTPREIEICTMIKSGLTSKEISGLLHISPQTTERHRNNIRRKLGITRKKINLATYLQSL